MEARRDIIVIGASAGGIQAVQTLLAALPPDLPAAVFVVVHVSGRGPGVLVKILAKASRLSVEQARHGEPIQPGRVYVAWPDHHLILADGHVQLGRGPRENRCRPAIDALFRSAADSHGERVIGVLLTGLLDDGTAGLQAIKRAGGAVVVQDPSDALFGDMPQNALDAVAVDYCLPLAEIPRALDDLTGMTVATRPGAATDSQERMMKSKGQVAPLSFYACPDCGGVLSEIESGDVLRFRCHVGHAFSTQALLESQDDGLEYALWAAVRILEEKMHFYRRLAQRHGGGKMRLFAQSLNQKAAEAEGHAAVIRQMLESGAVAKLNELPGKVSQD